MALPYPKATLLIAFQLAGGENSGVAQMRGSPGSDLEMLQVTLAGSQSHGHSQLQRRLGNVVCRVPRVVWLTFDCAGSLLLCELFSRCSERGAALLYRVRASRRSGFSCSRSQAPERLGLSSCSSWALEHRLNSCGAWV